MHERDARASRGTQNKKLNHYANPKQEFIQMDFLQIIVGRILLEYLGASVRFLYVNLRCLLNDDDFTTFSGIWSPTGSNKKKEGNSSLNHMIGVLFLGALILLLIIFNT